MLIRPAAATFEMRQRIDKYEASRPIAAFSGFASRPRLGFKSDYAAIERRNSDPVRDTDWTALLGLLMPPDQLRSSRGSVLHRAFLNGNVTIFPIATSTILTNLMLGSFHRVSLICASVMTRSYFAANDVWFVCGREFSLCNSRNRRCSSPRRSRLRRSISRT